MTTVTRAALGQLLEVVKDELAPDFSIPTPGFSTNDLPDLGMPAFRMPSVFGFDGGAQASGGDSMPATARQSDEGTDGTSPTTGSREHIGNTSPAPEELMNPTAHPSWVTTTDLENIASDGDSVRLNGMIAYTTFRKTDPNKWGTNTLGSYNAAAVRSAIRAGMQRDFSAMWVHYPDYYDMSAIITVGGRTYQFGEFNAHGLHSTSVTTIKFKEEDDTIVATRDRLPADEALAILRSEEGLAALQASFAKKTGEPVSREAVIAYIDGIESDKLMDKVSADRTVCRYDMSTGFAQYEREFTPSDWFMRQGFAAVKGFSGAKEGVAKAGHRIFGEG